MIFPKHEASLHLTHNDHKSVYETVEENTNEGGDQQKGEWVSDEQKQKAFETQDYWELQWYPDTPVGFVCLWAADLDVLLDHAKRIGG